MAVMPNGEGNLKPQWVCLRDCFTYNRLHGKGGIYTLPAGVEVSPKNFKLVDEAPTPAAEPQSPVKIFKCLVCGKVVSTGLALAGHSRSHRKDVTHGSTNA